jgi:hypothetical protein
MQIRSGALANAETVVRADTGITAVSDFVVVEPGIVPTYSGQVTRPSNPVRGEPEAPDPQKPDAGSADASVESWGDKLKQIPWYVYAGIGGIAIWFAVRK